MNAQGQPTSSNFGFLAKRYPQLERLGALGERYFSNDPIVSQLQFVSSVKAGAHARVYSPPLKNIFESDSQTGTGQ
jgi:hypothetical protein